VNDDPLRRPIGWWLKHVDGLLDLAFEATLGAQDVSRRQWQILNGLAEGTPVSEVLSSLTVFGDPDGVRAAVTGLVERGWLRDRTGSDPTTEEPPVRATPEAPVRAIPEAPVQLTDEGREQHSRIAAEVRAMRGSVTDGLSAADYQAVVTGLARMAENLERRLA